MLRLEHQVHIRNGATAVLFDYFSLDVPGGLEHELDCHVATAPGHGIGPGGLPSGIGQCFSSGLHREIHSRIGETLEAKTSIGAGPRAEQVAGNLPREVVEGSRSSRQCGFRDGYTNIDLSIRNWFISLVDHHSRQRLGACRDELLIGEILPGVPGLTPGWSQTRFGHQEDCLRSRQC